MITRWKLFYLNQIFQIVFYRKNKNFQINNVEVTEIVGKGFIWKFHKIVYQP